MHDCIFRLEHDLDENGRKLGAARGKERDSRILHRLWNAFVVPKDTSSITVDILAVDNLRRLISWG